MLKKTLTNTTLIKMGIGIAIVIILMTLLSYFYIVLVLKSQTLAQLEKYSIERGKRESQFFLLAQDNNLLVKKTFYQQLEKMGFQADPQAQFEQLFAESPDGTTRNRNQSIKEFDTTQNPSVFIGTQVKINADIRRRVIISYNLLTHYGPAWSNRFANLYITAPENILLSYWPGKPWGLIATADLNIQNEEYFYVSDNRHNHERIQTRQRLNLLTSKTPKSPNLVK